MRKNRASRVMNSALICASIGTPAWMKVDHVTRSLVLLLCLSLSWAAQGREPPSPQCIDARQVSDSQQIDAHTVVLRTDDGIRASAMLGTACPDLFTEGDVRLLAPDGWLCGGADDAIVTRAQRCAVESVAHIDARRYAELLQRGRADNTLDAVVVTGRRVRGFAGTTDYCVRTSGLRSWQDSIGGVTVEVSPRKSGGNRYYRLETAGRCGAAVNADSVELLSGLENGMVCGHPGDRVVFRKLYEGADPMNMRGVTAMQRFLQSGLAADAGCQITRVYPVEG